MRIKRVVDTAGDTRTRLSLTKAIGLTATSLQLVPGSVLYDQTGTRQLDFIVSGALNGYEKNLSLFVRCRVKESEVKNTRVLSDLIEKPLVIMKGALVGMDVIANALGYTRHPDDLVVGYLKNFEERLFYHFPHFKQVDRAQTIRFTEIFNLPVEDAPYVLEEFVRMRRARRQMEEGLPLSPKEVVRSFFQTGVDLGDCYRPRPARSGTVEKNMMRLQRQKESWGINMEEYWFETAKDCRRKERIYEQMYPRVGEHGTCDQNSLRRKVSFDLGVQGYAPSRKCSLDLSVSQSSQFTEEWRGDGFFLPERDTHYSPLGSDPRSVQPFFAPSRQALARGELSLRRAEVTHPPRQAPPAPLRGRDETHASVDEDLDRRLAARNPFLCCVSGQRNSDYYHKTDLTIRPRSSKKKSARTESAPASPTRTSTGSTAEQAERLLAKVEDLLAARAAAAPVPPPPAAYAPATSTQPPLNPYLTAPYGMRRPSDLSTEPFSQRQYPTRPPPSTAGSTRQRRLPIRSHSATHRSSIDEFSHDGQVLAWDDSSVQQRTWNYASGSLPRRTPKTSITNQYSWLRDHEISSPGVWEPPTREQWRSMRSQTTSRSTLAREHMYLPPQDYPPSPREQWGNQHQQQQELWRQEQDDARLQRQIAQLRLSEEAAWARRQEEAEEMNKATHKGWESPRIGAWSSTQIASDDLGRVTNSSLPSIEAFTVINCGDDGDSSTGRSNSPTGVSVDGVSYDDQRSESQVEPYQRPPSPFPLEETSEPRPISRYKSEDTKLR